MKNTFGAALFLLVAVTAAIPWISSSEVECVTAEEILGVLDEKCRGCGPDAYIEGNVVEHAMAFGLLASVGSELNDPVLTRDTADWLIAHASPSPSATGWGLDFAWDAFQDGTVNPPSTVYGITTALAVRGLLDAHEATGNPDYLATATAALEYYSGFFTETETGGYFWYSDQEEDAVNTFNVSAMLLGQYARAAELVDDPSFETMASAAFNDLLSHRREADGLVYWSYSALTERPNDSVHAAYVVQGILDYVAASQSAPAPIPDGAIDYLQTFVSEGGIREFSPIHDLSQDLNERPARLWGVGMLMHTLDDAGREVAALQAARQLSSYADVGGFANLPGGEPDSDPRMVAHAALGVASLKLSSE